MIKYSVGNILHSFRNTKNVNVIMVNIIKYILNNGKIKAKDIASHFKISLNTANNWIKEWLENGFLVRENDKQIRNVDYILTKKYQEKIK